VSSSIKENFHGHEPYVGRDKGESGPSARTHGVFRARKSGADHPWRAGAGNRDWIGGPLRFYYRAKGRNRDEVAARKSELESYFAAFSLAIVQIGQGKI